MLHTPGAATWSWGRRVGFVFSFVFFALLIFPFPITAIPGVDMILTPYNSLLTIIVNWAGTTLLNLPGPIEMTFTGSGDKLYDWVWYFVVLCLTVFIGTIWLVLDKKRANYNKLYNWALYVLTLYLAYYMFIYGIIKLLYLQFLPLNFEQLFETYGQSSPMRLLWTFMGFSKAYTMFAGASETLAAILLMFNRTRTLGALVAAGVMMNVFMMNMSYDVPVKLFSFQLMLAGLFIASRDLGRIAKFAVNRSAPAHPIEPLIAGAGKGRYAMDIIKFLFLGFVIIMQFVNGNSAASQYGTERAKPPLYGIYNVDLFVHNADTLAPVLTDTLRWKRLLMDYASFSSIVMMDDSIVRFSTTTDTVESLITFTSQQDTSLKYVMHYGKLNRDLLLEGVFKGDSLRIDMRNYDLRNFALLNRGFHWVNDVPYNRYHYGQ